MSFPSMKAEIFQCNLCLKNFAQKRYLKNHLSRCINKKISEPVSFACSKCDKIFPKSAALKRHELHHSKIKIYQCTSCTKSFVQRSHLKRHAETVHGNKNEKNNSPAICYYCEKTFHTTWQLIRHERTMHAFAENLYKCRICGQKFDNQRIYVNHLENHKGLKRFACKICNLAFQRKTELNAHSSAKHRTGFVFICFLCDRSFNQRIQFDRHFFKEHPSSNLRQEENVSRDSFLCKYCSISFEEKNNLLAHINEKHFRKVFRSPTSELNVESASSSSNSNSVCKNVRLIIKFENTFGPSQTLQLGRYMPDSFTSENPRLVDLELDLLRDHVFCSGEIIIVEIPVKFTSETIPDSLNISYI